MWRYYLHKANNLLWCWLQPIQVHPTSSAAPSWRCWPQPTYHWVAWSHLMGTMLKWRLVFTDINESFDKCLQTNSSVKPHHLNAPLVRISSPVSSKALAFLPPIPLWLLTAKSKKQEAFFNHSVSLKMYIWSFGDIEWEKCRQTMTLPQN